MGFQSDTDVKDYTGQLYATPSILDGIAGLIDFTDPAETYNTSDSIEEADYYAAASDWNAVGQDLRIAMAQVDTELKK